MGETSKTAIIRATVEFEEEASHLIDDRNYRAEIQHATGWVADCFPNAAHAFFAVVEGAEEDSEPHLVLYVDDSSLTTDAFVTATQNFIDKMLADAPNLRLSLLPGRK